MSAMIHHKFPPSTDLWMCVHGVAYPDVCRDCLVASYPNAKPLEWLLKQRDEDLIKEEVQELLADREGQGR
jgi:hypothetical protein